VHRLRFEDTLLDVYELGFLDGENVMDHDLGTLRHRARVESADF